MKYLLYILSLALLASCTKNEALPNQEKAFIKYYGGVGDQQASDLLQKDDGGYVLFGTTNSLGAVEKDMHLIATDELGNEIWSKTYGDSLDNEGIKVRATTDGGYILIGNSSKADSSKILVIKTDATGIEEWQTTLQNSDAAEFDILVGRDILVDSINGGYVLCGYTTEVNTLKPNFDANSGLDEWDTYIARLDEDGSLVWKAVYGFPKNDFGEAIILLEGDYILVGSSELVSPSVATGFLVARFGVGSNIPIDNKIYDDISLDNLVLSYACATQAGGLAFIGRSLSQYIVLTELDRNLDPVISPYEIVLANGQDTGGIHEAPGEGFLISSTDLGSVNQIHLLKVATDGSILLDQTYGGNNGSTGAAVLQLNDGFAITGTVNLSTNNKTTLIRTNSTGGFR